MSITNFKPQGDVGKKPTGDLSKKTNSFKEIQEKIKDVIPKNQFKEISEIKKESPYSQDINENIRSLDELEVYKDLDLEEKVVNDRTVLISNEIDPNFKDENGVTNLERMQDGKAPIGKDGKPMEAHHIGQKHESPLAELSKTDHQKNDSVLHTKEESQIDRNKFNTERANHWKERAKDFEQE